MNRLPQISIIVPAYNASGTIGTTLNSVLDQTFQDFEIIVIDDESTDDTKMIIAGLKDPRIQCHTFTNSGPAKSRNRGLRIARGEYTAFLDADDVWRPSKLKNQFDKLSKNQDAAFVYGWADFVDIDNRFIFPDSRPIFAGDVYKQLLIQNFIISGSNSLFRTRVLAELGGFNEGLLAVEDWELHTRIASRYQVMNIPEVVVHYRQSPNSLSNQFDVMENAFEEANRTIYSLAPVHLSYLKNYSAASFYLYLATKAFQSTNGRLEFATGFAILIARCCEGTKTQHRNPFKKIFITKFV